MLGRYSVGRTQLVMDDTDGRHRWKRIGVTVKHPRWEGETSTYFSDFLHFEDL